MKKNIKNEGGIFMKIIAGLKYSDEHEWVRVEGNKAYIGITDYAQEHLGDIVFVELPSLGDTLDKGDTLCVLESVKAASDVYCPLAGKILAVNKALIDNPALINEDAYEAWLAVLEISDKSELADLLNEAEYEEFCQE
jgi:glycine cleavage system H protein